MSRQAYIDPFVKSAIDVMATMCSVSPVAGEVAQKEGRGTWGVVTGVIELAGADTNGKMMLSFDEACVLDLVSRMLMEEYTALSQEVLDAVGELTNIITGCAKSDLANLGLNIDMATPIVVKGQGVAIEQSSDTPILSIPFKTAAGQFVIETNLSRR